MSVSGEPLSGDLLLAIPTCSASDVPGSFFVKKSVSADIAVSGVSLSIFLRLISLCSFPPAGEPY